ncbi:enoyl-CoA hydratase-related protein [Bradymonas sediminis]|uniref:Enoyl-CoA hydratase n=1 Tax=Bradymonas sediminis TaxID=1548548 RepID=A0A2Z4FH04_9DELT|nr:enoyl-CoA hydratase-related protein [Bradymonas sediminis]AWV87896.1 enoyl-CoA hydratase [Bradymonas sediminis]TDP62912.1 short chain enoyl-CoA hydratase [Bradymonas sediminis]
MSEETVLLKQVDQDGLCTLTLNRPAAMNSLNGALVEALDKAFYELRHDDSVRVVILTAAGDRAFCAGADLKERSGMSEAQVRQRIDDYRRCFGAIDSLPKPVICAINGFAFGGGLEIALACDFRVVAAETKVGLTECRLGIIPGAGGTQRLARLVGASRAKLLIFTAARLSGDEALEIGLVTASVPRAELMDAARALGRKMLDSAPIALAQAKIAIDAGMQTDLHTGLEIESRAYAVTLPTEDRLEGLAAFREKRKPNFQGK